MKCTTWRLAAVLALVGFIGCSSSRHDSAQSRPDVAKGEPAMKKAELGKAAPDFALTDLDGKSHKLSDYRGKPVVLEWFSPACPYCVYAYSDGSLTALPDRLRKQGVVWLSVNSQNPKHPGADVEKNRAFVMAHHMEAPMLMDPAGAVGRAYGAKTTPHLFVIDAKGVLVYAGGLDNAPLGRVDGDAKIVNYVDAAIADVRAGKPVAIDNARAYG